MAKSAIEAPRNDASLIGSLNNKVGEFLLKDTRITFNVRNNHLLDHAYECKMASNQGVQSFGLNSKTTANDLPRFSGSNLIAQTLNVLPLPPGVAAFANIFGACDVMAWVEGVEIKNTNSIYAEGAILVMANNKLIGQPWIKLVSVPKTTLLPLYIAGLQSPNRLDRMQWEAALRVRQFSMAENQEITWMDANSWDHPVKRLRDTDSKEFMVYLPLS
jgi:hypothetical protein